MVVAPHTSPLCRPAMIPSEAASSATTCTSRRPRSTVPQASASMMNNRIQLWPKPMAAGYVVAASASSRRRGRRPALTPSLNAEVTVSAYSEQNNTSTGPASHTGPARPCATSAAGPAAIVTHGNMIRPLGGLIRSIYASNSAPRRLARS